MPTLYIIAGPPGIGKSTYGEDLMPPFVKLLNHDLINTAYKYQNIENYEERANIRANAFIKENLNANANFGVELNLGFESHYDFIRWVRKNSPQYQISIFLFFTDDIQICLDRALLRAQAGGHLVEPDIIKKMYQDTIHLLRENIKMVNQLQFINITYDTNRLVYSGYYPNKKLDFIEDNLPNWVTDKFSELL